MNKKTRRWCHVRGSQLIAYISVALLLLILGLVSLTGITASRVTDSIRSNVGFVVMVDEAGWPASADSLKLNLQHSPWVADMAYSDAATVLARWNDMMGDDCGDMLDINPFLPEYDIKVRPQWASPDSITSLMERMLGIDCVYDVKAHTDMVGNVNHTIRSVILILLILAALLTLIAVVLVHNMVRMEIYAHRLTINTMKYVGATNAFIRRPYVRDALTGGALAGLSASIAMIGITIYAGSIHESVEAAVSWPWIALTSCGLIAGGAALCAIFSLLATTKYLRKKRDELFE